jgi:hypothetical protein
MSDHITSYQVNKRVHSSLNYQFDPLSGLAYLAENFGRQASSSRSKKRGPLRVVWHDATRSQKVAYLAADRQV